MPRLEILMTYRSILVGIDIDAAGDSIIALATELATRSMPG